MEILTIIIITIITTITITITITITDQKTEEEEEGRTTILFPKFAKVTRIDTNITQVN